MELELVSSFLGAVGILGMDAFQLRLGGQFWSRLFNNWRTGASRLLGQLPLEDNLGAVN